MYLLKKAGLNPLAITFDNTWSSVTSVENLKVMLKTLNIDLWTYVVDSEEFNDISRSFLLASVPDADIPNDIAITTVYYMAMDKFDVNYAIDGHSFRTEGMAPLGWTYMDGKYVESVQKKFGTVPLKTFPNLEINYWLKHMTDQNKKRLRLLYHVNYEKQNAIDFLQKEFGWKWYGGHHYENDYTKFVKGFLLPIKFNIDKRKVEFSALIRSGQMSREEALRILQTPPQLEPKFIAHVKKRLKLTDEDFEKIMKLPIRSHHDYETYHPFFVENREMFRKLLEKGLISHTFFEKYTKM